MQDTIQTVASLAALAAASISLYATKQSNRFRAGRQAGVSTRVIVDSCALIDGRIVDLAKLGFLHNDIVIPEFVIAELQMLADGGDSHKRERARYGLEVVQQLQNEPDLEVLIGRYGDAGATIDEKLILAAKADKAALFTNDFNLNQVASIEGVQVLNINELSHALRPHVLPSEKLMVKIVQPGSNRDQGVGYLDDGTMIVVDGALRDVGAMVEATVTRTHQTVAGKMIFAKKDAPQQLKKAKGQQAPLQAVIKKRLPSSPNPRRHNHRERSTGVSRTGSQQRRRAPAGISDAEASLLSAIDNSQAK